MLKQVQHDNISELMEHFFNCPYCGEEISFVLDTSIAKQSYIEDCEVCCNPINVKFEMEDSQVVFFEADKID